MRGRGVGKEHRGRRKYHKQYNASFAGFGQAPFGFANAPNNFGQAPFAFANAPNSTRTILTNYPITGKCLNWNEEKSFGWIFCNDPIAEFLGERSNGKIFIHRGDLVDCDYLEKDDQVKFYLYGGERGLGAQNCKKINDFGENDIPTENMATAVYAVPDNSLHLKCVITIQVENTLMIDLIGKKGRLIQKLQEDTGAKIDIQEGGGASRFINLTGTIVELQAAAREITKQLSQNTRTKMVFLVHYSKTGRLIGKKGANIKKIRGDENNIFVNISNDPIIFNSQPVQTMSVSGSKENIEGAIDESVSQLAAIYKQMLETYEEDEQF